MSNITIDATTGAFVSAAPADQAALTRQADSFIAVADSYIVDSPEMRAMAHADMTAWKRRKAELEEQRMSVTRPIEAAKKALMAIFKPAEDRLDRAISTVSGCIIVYDAKVREEAAIERRRLEAIAETERKRLQALADEERRKAAELARAAAEAAEAERNKAAAILAAAAAEDARLKQLAEAAARAGDMEAQREAKAQQEANMKKAQEEAFAAQVARENQERIDAAAQHEAAARAQAAEAAQAATSAVAVAKVDTKGSRAAWQGECVDKMALLKFIVANPAFLHLVVVDQTALNQTAKSMKDAMKIDGCRAFQKHSVVAARS